LIDDCRVELAAAGVIEAITRRNTGVIFDWLINAVSFQGISDAAASSYLNAHERIASLDIEAALARKPSCTKLRGYHRLFDCGYRKGTDRCNEPDHKPGCPLPRHDLRNGGLNQAAYSLHLFMRDVALGDFVGWIDYQLRRTSAKNFAARPSVLLSPIVAPMAHIYGIGWKTLNMSMATLLLGGDAERAEWIAAGASMIAVDTLVHNWLHRTGILKAICRACFTSVRCGHLKLPNIEIASAFPTLRLQ
jgi:hypothetical protein